MVGIAGFAGGAALMPVALVAPLRAGPVPIFVPAFFLTVVCVYLYAGPYDAITQSVVSPGLRASAMTLTLLVAHLFGENGKGGGHRPDIRLTDKGSWAPGPA